MPFESFLPYKLNGKDLHQLIIGGVTPRPIALVSSISKNGIANLAPYSFFNAISSKPPILAFAISRGPESRPNKDTLINLESNPECVINIVDDKIARQMSLCSVAYQYEVSEFKKAGLTELCSDLITPPRVKESPVQFECTVKDILELGKRSESAHLVLCDVVKIHINKEVMTTDKPRIDPWSLRAVGRLGRSYYVSVEGDNIFEMYQPVSPDCIGFDGLPASVRHSPVLTGSELATLASCCLLPDKNAVLSFCKRENITNDLALEECHLLAKRFLSDNNKQDALICVMIPEAQE